jgi:hypothetical protein
VPGVGRAAATPPASKTRSSTGSFRGIVLPSRRHCTTPRWLVVWWCVAAPWPLLFAGMYGFDETITRWRTGGAGRLISRWDDSAFLLFLNASLLAVWIVVAASFLIWHLSRERVRVSPFVPIGILLALLAAGVL